MSHNAQIINGIEPTTTGAFSLSTDSEYISFGVGGSSSYSTSPATSLAQLATFYMFDTAPVNTIMGASIGSGWISSFTLPAGRYHVVFQFRVVFSATGQAAIGIYDAANTHISTPMRIGTSGIQASHGFAYIDISSDQTFTFKLASVTNVASIASQLTVPSEHNFLFILKVA